MTAHSILTASGATIDLVHLQPSDVQLQDISHSLACLNRFTGHARRPYSVAEHSLLVLEITERMLVSTTAGRLAALMHDAHEAYVSDLASPIKPLLGTEWARLEMRASSAVHGAFWLRGAFAEHAAVIKAADLIALATEREQLMPPGGPPWQMLQGVAAVTWVDLMAPERTAMRWREWADRFEDSFEALEFARKWSV